VPRSKIHGTFLFLLFVEVGFEGSEVLVGGEAEVFELLASEFRKGACADAFENTLGTDFVASGLAVFVPKPDVFGRAVEKLALNALWDGAKKLAAELGFGV